MKVLAALALLAGLAAGGWAQESLVVRTEVGSFNRAYQDREYISPTPVTFAVPYWSLGTEYRRRDARGNVLGFDLAQTTLGSGTKWNYNRTEVQPLTILTLVGAYAGLDSGWWEADLGLVGLIQLQDFPAQGFYAADGSLVSGRPAGIDWNHRESWTLVSGQFRLFAVGGPHLVIRVAEGPLVLTQNLFHFQGVLPTATGTFDAELSFSSPLGYLIPGRGVLRSNERLAIGWTLGAPPFRVGLRLGFLLRTEVAGSGEIDLFHRLSAAVDVVLGD